MGWNRSWSVESKEFKFLLKDSSPVLMIQERRKDVQRAVNLRKKEQVWLVRIFAELVAVEDSRVFRDQTVPGFPRVLAQKCGNKNGRFLVLEEYNSRGKCGSIFVPEGRNRQGWNRFVEELQNVLQFSAHSWEIPKEKRRYSEVLCDSMKEGHEKSLAAPANHQMIPVSYQGRKMEAQAKCQGKDMTVKGDLTSSVSIKCLSVAKDKDKVVGGDVSCCEGCLAAGGRDFIILKLEAMHVEICKYLGQLKSCKCCTQQCGKGVAGPSTLQSNKEIISVDVDKGPDEAPWFTKEKKKSNGKGLLPRPNISWVAGRTGFGFVGSQKAQGHDMGLNGMSESLGRKSRKPESHAQPVAFSTGMLSTPDDAIPAESCRKIAHEGRTTLGQSMCLPKDPDQPAFVPSGTSATLTANAPVEESAVAKEPESASLGPPVSVLQAQPLRSGPPSAMDIETLAEPPIVPAQLVPADSSRNKQSTSSVSTVLPATDRGVSTQGNEPRDTSVFKEVYRRRDGSTTTPVKGTELSFLKEGLDPRLKEGVFEGSVVGEPLGEPFLCSPDRGEVSEGLSLTDDEVNEELESSPVMQELLLVKEVSRLAGLSCDGQEGLQEECLKRILVEKYGQGGGSFHTTVQQEEERSSRERENSSDYDET